MNVASIKTRFFVSAGVNVARAGISFLTGVLIARGLTPVGYGDLFFLLGSFTAVRALLDMGTSSAFYTFIAQKRRAASFYILYFSWLCLQFLITVFVLAALLPDNLVNNIWLGHGRDAIILAFLAAFMQQQVWSTVVQVCEAARKTVMVQSVGLAIVIIHLGVVLVLMWAEWLTITAVFITLLAEYASATFLVWMLMRAQENDDGKAPDNEAFRFVEVVFSYWEFCRPLIIIGIATFAYQFLDRWLLQRFGGAEQQGFYQISVQFAAVSLLATTSILSIFWKEIAEAYKQENYDRVKNLYHKVSKSLLMLGAVISCFLIPWSEQLTLLMLGADYTNAWPILAIMFLYPVHQSMGQINGTMFMACERTSPYMYLTLFGMLISIPVTYFVLVPESGWSLPGLDMGAQGLALKMVGMNILLVNIQGWMIAHYHGWKYEWAYQVEGLFMLTMVGFSIKEVLVSFFDSFLRFENESYTSLLMLGIASLLYLLFVCLYVWIRPRLFGLEQEDVRNIVERVMKWAGVLHAK